MTARKKKSPVSVYLDPEILAMLAVFWISMSAMTALLVDFFQRQVIPAMIGG